MTVPAQSDPTRGALFDPVFGAADLAPLLSDRAWITALLEVEVAITRAAEKHGRATPAEVVAVAAAADDLAATWTRPNWAGSRRPGAIR